jgi:hypothetical protein
MEKENQDLCKHPSLKEFGSWDGKEIKTGKLIGGPMVRCKQCGKKQNLTWEEWNKIPLSNREGLLKRPDYKNLF